MKRRARLERAAERALAGLLAGAAGLLALLVWWTAARVATAGGAPWTIAPPALLLGAVAAALALRRRWIARLGAVRALALLASGLVPWLALEALANLSDAGGYLYYADCLRYFRWQRYDALPDHVHPPESAISLSWGRVRTDARGWRVEDPAPPADALPVLALGDSVVFGWGVPGPAAVCPQVERALTARLGRPVQVLNSGNGSYTSLDELLALLERGRDAKPAAAFVLAIENDFRDRPPYRDQVQWLRAHGASAELLSALEAVAVERPGPRGPVSQPWSALYGAVAWTLHRSFLVVSLAQWAERRAVASGTGTPGPSQVDPTPQVNAPAPVTTTGGQPPPATPPGPGDPPAVGSTDPERERLAAELAPRFPWLRCQTACLQEIARVCAADGVPLTLYAYLPADPLLERWLRLAFPQVVTLQVAPGELPPLLRSRTDPHWNAAGSQLFARQIAEGLRLERKPRHGEQRAPGR